MYEITTIDQKTGFHSLFIKVHRTSNDHLWPVRVQLHVEAAAGYVNMDTKTLREIAETFITIADTIDKEDAQIKWVIGGTTDDYNNAS